MNSSKNKILSYLAALIISVAIFAGAGTTAKARVDIKVNLTTQRMNVSVDGSHYATYKVSSGRRGYTTPTGRYRIQRMTRMHYSSKYNNSPMPNSIFYHGGYAIHGTNSIRRLGRVASHGCVRLHPANARELYNLVQSEGRRNTRIKVYRGSKVAAKNRRKKSKNRVHFSKRKNSFFIFGGLDLTN